MLTRRLLIAILLSLWTLAAHAKSSVDEELAMQALNRLPVLRMVITHAPGNGHQAANATLVKQLREFGYRGHIELFYDPSEKSKLEYLLPPFKGHGPDCQWLEALDVKICPLPKNPRSLVEVPLVLSAADDTKLAPRYVNARFSLVVEPARWRREAWIANYDGDRLAYLKVENNLPMKMTQPSQDDLRVQLEREFAHSPDLNPKIEGLLAALELGASERIDLMANYGLGIGGVSRLAVIVESLTLAANAHPEKFPLGAALLMISNFNATEWQEFHERLDKSALKDTIKLKVIDVKSPDVRKELEGLKQGEIAILKVGKVSQQIWNLLMRESTLPPTAAGHNGLDYLSQLGQPFLMTTSHTSAIDVQKDDDPLIRTLADLTSAIEHESTFQLAKFYYETRQPGSEINKLFAQYADRREKMTDRTCQSLLESRAIWEPNKVDDAILRMSRSLFMLKLQKFGASLSNALSRILPMARNL